MRDKDQQQQQLKFINNDLRPPNPNCITKQTMDESRYFMIYQSREALVVSRDAAT